MIYFNVSCLNFLLDGVDTSKTQATHQMCSLCALLFSMNSKILKKKHIAALYGHIMEVFVEYYLFADYQTFPA